MTDQPSQQPPDETPDDVPAQLAPDAPAEVRPSGEPSGPAPAVPPPAPAPPPAFGTTEPGPSTYASTPSGGQQSLFPPERPEYAVGAAFAGGLVLALILKRLAH